MVNSDIASTSGEASVRSDAATEILNPGGGSASVASSGQPSVGPSDANAIGGDPHVAASSHPIG